MNPAIEKDLINYLPAEIAWRYKAVPHSFNQDTLTLLIDSNTLEDNTQGELEIITGYEIKLVKENAEQIKEQLNRLYRNDVSTGNSVTTEENVNKSDFLLRTVQEAQKLSSSDIHIESYADTCRVRFRIDGKLIERYHIPKDQYPAFINKIKIKSGLDIAEKRLPQDGRILFTDDNNKTDIRVSVLPTLYGEKIVLRLLSNDTSHVDLKKIGLDEHQLSDYSKTLKKPHGIILISGPTGSGKTTTLYATLKLLNKKHSNILTIEDPIEYTLDGINQVQLKENIGLTFASALRTFLRQDPDIIMLGEIRDPETAQMAIRAALTGHLVLSTIHTNSAWGIISRLIDMNVPSFLLANTLNMAVAQRLVRKLCPHCKRECNNIQDQYPDLSQFLNSITSFIPEGCNSCYFTGYIGRAALYEVIPIDRELSMCIKDNILDISDKIKEKKISSLQQNALHLVKTGITSVEEVYPILLNY